MKWFALILCSVTALAFNACEKHNADELKKIEEQPEHDGAKTEHVKEAEPAKDAPEKK